MIERFSCRELSVFASATVLFSPGINVIIGENGSGKTHLMKASYALASSGMIRRHGGEFAPALASALIDIFRPLGGKLSSLRRRGAEGRSGLAADFTSGRRVSAIISPEDETLNVPDDNYPRTFTDDPIFIPARETVSFMRGFVGLASLYDLPFDRTYRDLACALDVPAVRDDKLRDSSRRIMGAIERVCGGRFDFREGGGAIFRDERGESSANVVSEGLLKFAALSRLLENGMIRPGDSGPIFWDLPESGLNPKLLKVLAGIIIELSKNGLQLIISTHSYILLKYLQILADRDSTRYHLLTHGPDGATAIESADRYDMISRDPIAETYENLFDLELGRLPSLEDAK